MAQPGGYYMRVKIFMNTAGSNIERDILRNMHNGISQIHIPADRKEQRRLKAINKEKGLGFDVQYDYSERHTSCDCAVMYGSWKPERSNIHHIVRTSIVEKSKSFICIETPLLNRKVFEENEYRRVAVNGFLNRDAYFGPNVNYPNDRLKKLGIIFNGWNRNKGDKIVIAMQLNGDASLRHNDINEWCYNTVDKLLTLTDRPIEIRLHPALSDKGLGNHDELLRYFNYSKKNYSNVTFVKGKDVSWKDQIRNAYCVVAYTSGLAIDAVIQGVPVIACDEGNFAWNVGETRLTNIENLQLADDSIVQQWLQNLSYCQWTFAEMESGKVWSHLKPGIEESIREWKECNPS
jgi:hypothetical protein